MRSALSIVFPFDGDDSQGIDLALACTVMLNLHQMQRAAAAGRPLPRLYESGVRYQRERCLLVGRPETCERFLTYEQLLAEGVGDCDDLASARCAELIVTGEDPKARACVYRSGGGYHAVVMRGNGQIEDPSAALGMPTRRRKT